MMQVSKKIDFNDPTILVAVRAAYLISNAIIFAVYFYCGMVIDKKKGASAFIPFSPIKCHDKSSTTSSHKSSTSSNKPSDEFSNRSNMLIDLCR
jgi:hypothetical protein